LKIYDLILHIDVEIKYLSLDSLAKAFLGCCSCHPAKAGCNSLIEIMWKNKIHLGGMGFNESYE
jgi:hypothetical protein